MHRHLFFLALFVLGLPSWAAVPCAEVVAGTPAYQAEAFGLARGARGKKLPVRVTYFGWRRLFGDSHLYECKGFVLDTDKALVVQTDFDVVTIPVKRLHSIEVLDAPQPVQLTDHQQVLLETLRAAKDSGRHVSFTCVWETGFFDYLFGPHYKYVEIKSIRLTTTGEFALDVFRDDFDNPLHGTILLSWIVPESLR